MIPVPIIKMSTIGAILFAIEIQFVPVQTAIGKISPNHNTQVTEITIAQTEGTSLSKQIGNVSRAEALIKSKVTNK